MRKLAALAGAGALVLVLAGPTFANGWWWGGSRDVAIVENGAVAVAETGGNSQSNVANVSHGGGVTVNGASGDRNMDTGDATAYAGALVVANTHVGCGTCGSSRRHTDYANVENGAIAGASTGGNGQDDLALVSHGGGVTVNGGNGDRDLNTGASDATARAWTIVNTHWTGSW